MEFINIDCWTEMKPKKMKSGDKVFLKNLAKTLYERQIPVFDEDDPLFVEVFGAKLTFSVSK